MDRRLLCIGIDVQHPIRTRSKRPFDRIAVLAKALADPVKDKLVEQGIVAVSGTSENSAPSIIGCIIGTGITAVCKNTGERSLPHW